MQFGRARLSPGFQLPLRRNHSFLARVFHHLLAHFVSFSFNRTTISTPKLLPVESIVQKRHKSSLSAAVQFRVFLQIGSRRRVSLSRSLSRSVARSSAPHAFSKKSALRPRDARARKIQSGSKAQKEKARKPARGKRQNLVDREELVCSPPQIPPPFFGCIISSAASFLFALAFSPLLSSADEEKTLRGASISERKIQRRKTREPSALFLFPSFPHLLTSLNLNLTSRPLNSFSHTASSLPFHPPPPTKNTTKR